MRAGLLADQVVVHRRGEQQRRDGRVLGVGVAVGEHEDALAVGDGGRRLGAHAVEGLAQRAAAAGDAVQTRHHRGRELGTVAVAVDVDELGQLVVVDDRERQLDLHARLRAGLEQVGLGADGGRQRGDELLADGVERRVGDLREQLLEVVEQHARAGGEHRDRRVGAHRAERLAAGPRHRRDQQLEVFVGVPEGLLALQHRLVARHHVHAVGQVVQVHEPLLEPLGVGLRAGELFLDLTVADDAALGGVDEEHAARLQPALLHDRAGSTSTTPASLAMITRSSSVTQ